MGVILLAVFAFADDPVWTWTGASAATNYLPTACNTDGSLLPIDSVKATMFHSRFHFDEHGFCEVTEFSNDSADFDVHCPNGVVVQATFSHRIQGRTFDGCSGDSPHDHTWGDPELA